ncbi:HEAT repeat-containing protein 3-like [Crassostrea virginica]
MGKTKHKKFKIERPKPTGLVSVKEAENDLEREQPLPNNGMIQSLLEKLNAPSEEERECSCSTIANLVSQPSAVKLLLQHNIVKILAPVMLDVNPDIRVKALGALRNLSVDGGEMVCREMVRKDVLTPLVTLLKQYECNWVPDTPTGKNKKCLKSSIFCEAIHLLWNLCECCEEALEIFNRENLFPIVCAGLQHSVYGNEIAVTVANCLYTITEDNAPIIKMCHNPEVFQLINSLILKESCSSDLVLLKTLATGIMVNIHSGCGSLGGNVITSLLKSVSDVLMLDAMDAAPKLVGEDCSSQNGDNAMVTEGEREGKSHTVDVGLEEMQEEFRDVQNILTAQQIALEIVANICCTDDEGWEDLGNSESSSCDEETVEQEEEEAMEQETIDLFSSLRVSSEVQQAVKGFCVFEKVCSKCSSVDCSGLPKNVTKSFVNLQAHALLCMNNMVNSVEVDWLGGTEKLHQVWSSLASLLANIDESCRDEMLLEATTSAMGAVIQKLSSAETPKLSVSDIQFLFTLGRSSQLADIKVNILRIIATVGVVFSKQDGLPNADILKNIGIFLLTIVCGEKDLWVVSEALDCVFDVFGEDHLDAIDQEINLTNRLSKFVPEMKSRVNQIKKKPDEHYPVISTAKTNLIRFVKYKLSKKK